MKFCSTEVKNRKSSERARLSPRQKRLPEGMRGTCVIGGALSCPTPTLLGHLRAHLHKFTYEVLLFLSSTQATPVYECMPVSIWSSMVSSSVSLGPQSLPVKSSFSVISLVKYILSSADVLRKCANSGKNLASVPWI